MGIFRRNGEGRGSPASDRRRRHPAIATRRLGPRRREAVDRRIKVLSDAQHRPPVARPSGGLLPWRRRDRWAPEQRHRGSTVSPL